MTRCTPSIAKTTSQSPVKLLAQSIAPLALLALCASALALPQTRAKKAEAKDMPTVLAQAKEHFDAGRYAACMTDLKTCVGLTQKRWTEAIRAAMPAAPEGWTKVEPEEEQEDNAQAQAMLASLSIGVGTQVEQIYSKDAQRVSVTVTADSPMISMMGMMFSNPALLGANKELIEYGSHRAVLDTSNARRLDLQILISDKHLVQVTCPESEDFLFALFDQTAVDGLAAALGK